MQRNILESQLYSRSGRMIGPKNGAFPGLREMFYPLSNFARFSGQAERPAVWNGLKHSVCVAMLLAKSHDVIGFIKGLFHDTGEMWFGGDPPTPFKPMAYTEVERFFSRRLAQQLLAIWSGFNVEAHINCNYKPADRLMLDVESRLSLKVDTDHYLTEFRDVSSSDEARAEAEDLMKRVRKIDNDVLLDLVVLCIQDCMRGQGQSSKEAQNSVAKFGHIIYLD